MPPQLESLGFLTALFLIRLAPLPRTRKVGLFPASCRRKRSRRRTSCSTLAPNKNVAHETPTRLHKPRHTTKLTTLRRGLPSPRLHSHNIHDTRPHFPFSNLQQALGPQKFATPHPEILELNPRIFCPFRFFGTLVKPGSHALTRWNL